MTKTYDLTPAEYKVISGISANIAKRDSLSPNDKKETYKAIKEEFLQNKANDPQALKAFETWLNELNTIAGYTPKSAQKVTKPAKKERANAKIEPAKIVKSFEGLKGLTIKSKPQIAENSAVNMRLAESLKATKKVVKAANHKPETDAKNSALIDLYKAGLLTKAEIAHEYKQGHISLKTMLEILA